MHSKEFTDKLETLDEFDKRVAYNYFTKYETLNKLFNVILPKKKLINSSFGNYNAKIVFVVNFKTTNDKIIKEIKSVCESSKCDFYNTYITSIDKFGDRAIDLKFLSKELQIISPSRIVVFGDDDVKFKNSVSFDKKYLDEFISGTGDNLELLKEAQSMFLHCMYFALFGTEVAK